jgi:uncharacterized protein YuzB (UPF0349 family)
MLTINVIVRGEDKVLNGALCGEKFNLPFDEELYVSLKEKQAEYNTFEDASSVPAWEEEVKALLVEKEVDIIETACPDLIKDKKTGYYYVLVNGEMSKTSVPELLVEVILESVEKEISPEPIVKAWIRFLRNPNFTEEKAELFARYITAEIVDNDEVNRLIDEEGFTEEVAISRATYNDVAITQEGLIVCKKYAELITEGWEMDQKTNTPIKTPLYPQTPVVVDRITGEVSGGEDVLPEFAEELYFQPPVQRTNGDAFLCGDAKGHVIQVGKKHTLESWDQVNCNDDSHCVRGLHVGGWQYVQSYQGLNCQLLECFVDPAEIGAICDIHDGSDGAIRVREYFTYGAVKGRTKGIYHSSNYAKMKDAEWEDYKVKAVENANKLVAGIQDMLDGLGK